MWWTRAELKERAKESIRRNYWIMVVVALIAGIINGQIGGTEGFRMEWGKHGFLYEHSISDDCVGSDWNSYDSFYRIYAA